MAKIAFFFNIYKRVSANIMYFTAVATDCKSFDYFIFVKCSLENDRRKLKKLMRCNALKNRSQYHSQRSDIKKS